MRRLYIAEGHEIYVEDFKDDQIDEQIIMAYTGIMLTMVSGVLSQKYLWGES